MSEPKTPSKPFHPPLPAPPSPRHDNDDFPGPVRREVPGIEPTYYPPPPPPPSPGKGG